MEHKNLDSPGPLSSHIGPVHEHIYTPVIPSKHNVYTDRSNRKPLEEGEVILFPCEVQVKINAVLTQYNDILYADIFDHKKSTIGDHGKEVSKTSIRILRGSIPLLIETLQRALLSFEK